jgi:hypothetical protein
MNTKERGRDREREKEELAYGLVENTPYSTEYIHSTTGAKRKVAEKGKKSQPANGPWEVGGRANNTARENE